MKRTIYLSLLILTFAVAGFAQNDTFSDPNVEYTFEIPKGVWKKVVFPTATSPNVEYAYGDRLDGHFEVRKLTIREGEVISDLIQRDQEQKLQFQPGYVAGKEEPFAGALKGRVFNYEFTKSGKNMSGRFYYIRRGNDSQVYVIRFTGYRDKLRLIRNETDIIARTFDLKK